MNDRSEELRAKIKALKLPTDDSSSPAGSWSGKAPRPRPSLNLGTSGMMPSAAWSTTPGGDRLRLASVNEEQERKLKEIMNQTGILQINNRQYSARIDDLELISDLGNGTSGHVVEMRHVESGAIIAVKQMRRTGNNDENKRILMDLDVVLKSHCDHIVLCLGCFITDSDVWICMELMSTCFDKLLKQLKQSIPEAICGKVAVATLNALNYLKEKHGVIHRDVKPSNILLDVDGRVKLCDFGISGRLVDSKAKTRAAGCAAYMAPERIDPPNPNKPDYDIRADVWSLGITLVELATGHFPYRDCKTDFEVLAKVLQEKPPVLPRNGAYSPEFCSFVEQCLTKDYKDRPKYKKLLQHPFIKKYTTEEVDVGAWYRSHLKNFNNSAMMTPNNNQIAYEPLPAQSLSAVDRSFKPQPSPRIVRARRQTSQPAASTTSSYPSAIAERDRRPSFEVLMERNRLAAASGNHDLPHRDAVTAKPPPALTSPTDHSRSFSSSGGKHHLHHLGESSVLSRGGLSSAGSSSSAAASMSPTSRVYERWNPTMNGSHYPSASSGAMGPAVSSSTSSHLGMSSRSAATGSDPPDVSKNYPSMMYQSPRLGNKFEFTYPTTTSYITGSNSGGASASPHHRHFSNFSSTPSAVRRTSAEPHHHLPHHVAYQQHHFSSPQPSSASTVRASPSLSGVGSASAYAGDVGRPSRERLSRLDASTSSNVESTSASGHLLASPPSPSRERQGYFPASWRSALSSWTSIQSPLSFRRFRTASTDRSSGFESSRRFQPSYRSWNEKDNYHTSMKR